MAETQAEQENAEELRLGPVFDQPTAQPLTNTQALTLLNTVHATRKSLDPNYVPTPMVQQTKQYLERFSAVKSLKAAEAMVEALQESGVKPFEQCAIVNLLPITAQEVKALIPSLETVEDRFPEEEQLQAILDRVATLKDV